MCFEIDFDAERPTQTKVWKILAVTDDGRFLSPVVHGKLAIAESHPYWSRLVHKLQETQYALGVRKCIPDTAETTDSLSPRKSAAGLYVFLTERAARQWIWGYASRVCDFHLTPNLVLVECDVTSEDWLYTSEDEDYGTTAATYRALTPTRVVARYQYSGNEFRYTEI